MRLKRLQNFLAGILVSANGALLTTITPRNCGTTGELNHRARPELEELGE